MTRSVATILSRALLAPALVALLGAAAQAQITYTLIDSAAGDQAGHTLEGTITFDSVCGTGCTGANIVDFDFEVSGPSNYSLSYQSPADVDSGILPVIVTETEVIYDYTINASLGLSRDDTVLSWSGGPSPVYYSEFFDGVDFIASWTTLSSTVGPIAVVVPEPSTMFTAAAAGLLPFFRRQRNRVA